MDVSERTCLIRLGRGPTCQHASFMMNVLDLE